MVMTACDCETKLKANDVILVKAIALERIDHDGCLFDCLKIGEAEVHFEAVLGLPWHQTQLLEARKWPEDVRYLTLCRIVRQSFDVNGPGGVLRVGHHAREHFHDLLKLLLRLRVH